MIDVLLVFIVLFVTVSGRHCLCTQPACTLVTRCMQAPTWMERTGDLERAPWDTHVCLQPGSFSSPMDLSNHQIQCNRWCRWLVQESRRVDWDDSILVLSTVSVGPWWFSRVLVLDGLDWTSYRAAWGLRNSSRATESLRHITALLPWNHQGSVLRPRYSSSWWW